jgi:hypothetical protein
LGTPAVRFLNVLELTVADAADLGLPETKQTSHPGFRHPTTAGKVGTGYIRLRRRTRAQLGWPTACRPGADLVIQVQTKLKKSTNQTWVCLLNFNLNYLSFIFFYSPSESLFPHLLLS